MSLSHTILAMLNGKAQSGYDLKKSFGSGHSCFWQATMQQVYRELGKLEERGLVSPEVILQKGRPNKKLYSITAEGRSLLREWIGKPSKPTPIREDLIVKVLAAHLVDPETLRTELRRQQQCHKQQMTIYQTSWESSGCCSLSDLPLPEQCKCMTLRRGIRHEQSWIDWCEETIEWLHKNRQNLKN